MKVINSENGFLVYQKIFSALQANRLELIAWQVRPDSGERHRCNMLISAYNMETKSLHLEQDSATQVRMDQNLSIYFYSDDAQIIFKCAPQEIRDTNVSVRQPDEIKLLDEPDVNIVREKIGLPKREWSYRNVNFDDLGEGFMRVKSMVERSSRDQEFLNQEFAPVSLDEEEKMFAGKRETPRARPKTDKKVRIHIGGEDRIYKLFDLSQGGMGFLTNVADEFVANSQVQVVGFDDFKLDDPLIGTVKSVRQIEGIELEFKVGVKFDDGQS